jgi:hypothetical protein
MRGVVGLAPAGPGAVGVCGDPQAPVIRMQNAKCKMQNGNAEALPASRERSHSEFCILHSAFRRYTAAAAAGASTPAQRFIVVNSSRPQALR